MPRLLETLIIGSICILPYGSLFALVDGNSTLFPDYRTQTFLAVYYQQKPYIYIDNKTSELTGMIPKIFHKMKMKWEINIDFRLDVGSSENFTHLLWGNNTNKDLRDKFVIWLPLLTDLHHDDNHQLKDVDLSDIHLFPSLGMEVLVQRRKIGIVSKIAHGLVGCKHLFILALMTAVIFGISLWLCVSVLYSISGNALKCL